LVLDSPPGLFSADRSVLVAIRVPRWFLVAQLPFAGIVFALDGAGDAAHLRTAAGFWSGLSATAFPERRAAPGNA
jgi:hypothetical protein